MPETNIPQDDVRKKRNKDRQRETSRVYRLAHKEKRNAQSREWNSANRERLNTLHKTWLDENRERVRAKHKEWLSNNAGTVAEKYAAWYEANRKSKLAAHARWASENLERLRANNHRRVARINGNGGSHTVADIRELLEIQGGICAGCRKDIRAHYTVDHIIAIARGGSNDRSNLQLLCRSCNSSKKAMSPDDWAARIGKLFV